jgi:ankyrin repeat protein
MIYESSSNMPLASVQRYYECEWAEDFAADQKARVAIQMGNIQLLQTALNEGAKINHPTHPLLVEAAKREKFTLATFLVEKGADVNFPNPQGVTPLYAAAETGDTQLLEFLRDVGADVDCRGPENTTPLMTAAFHSHFRAMELLVEYGADVNAKSKDGISTFAYSRFGKAAWDRQARRSMISTQAQFRRKLISYGEYHNLVQDDFETLKSFTEDYGRIQELLGKCGAIDCRSKCKLLVFPKPELSFALNPT